MVDWNKWQSCVLLFVVGSFSGVVVVAALPNFSAVRADQLRSVELSVHGREKYENLIGEEKRKEKKKELRPRAPCRRTEILSSEY